jgi:aspartyl-tRNA(Asn)/glutamyl-tRNA(Gln) amidotransferase subunit C
MALTPDDIQRIALLARLELRDDERERMRSQINDFFGLVERMCAVDTAHVQPLAHPVDAFEEVALRLREDQPAEDIDRDANQRSAPAVDGGLYLVPRVIE